MALEPDLRANFSNGNFVRNSDLQCMRGEWPDWMEPIKAAVNVRFWEIARHRGTLDVATHCPVGQIVLHPHEAGLSATWTFSACAANGRIG